MEERLAASEQHMRSASNLAQAVRVRSRKKSTGLAGASVLLRRPSCSASRRSLLS
jgi:hypothetical protein